MIGGWEDGGDGENKGGVYIKRMTNVNNCWC